MEKKLQDPTDAPIGFGMALVQNKSALDAFSKLTNEQKNTLIGISRNIHSKNEMQNFVESIADNSPN